jgi:hypothetical protein
MEDYRVESPAAKVSDLLIRSKEAAALGLKRTVATRIIELARRGERSSDETEDQVLSALNVGGNLSQSPSRSFGLELPG